MRRGRQFGALAIVAGMLILISATAALGKQHKPQPEGADPAAEAAAAGGALFKTQVNLVVLHATVLDRNHRMVTGLPQEAFQVFEAGQPQRLTQFSNRDIPVSMGILVDSSASMIDKRPAVNAAALRLIRASNPDDEVFILNFKDTQELAQDYTSDIGALERGLSDVQMWGGTALLDALHAAVEHSLRGTKDKKVLLAITDGEDDASKIPLRQLLALLQKTGITVHTIGILRQPPSRARRNAEKMLKAIAKVSGGEAYFPTSVDQVEALAARIAHDIRSQYVLAYPVPSGSKPGFHSIRVKAQAAQMGKLVVRTRPGYFHEPETNSP